MTNALLQLLEAQYTLRELDVTDLATLKANGMTFTVRAFHAEGLGHVSVMRAKGFFGLMRMDTLMITPTERDLPLYSYDRIYAMGNDTLIVELYDTLCKPCELSAPDAVKARFSHLPERDPGRHWYDSIKLAQSISKKGKKRITPELDALAIAHLQAYLQTASQDAFDPKTKRRRSAAYVNGLLEQGGPSTDAFIKALGKETTARLFHDVLFGIS